MASLGWDLSFLYFLTSIGESHNGRSAAGFYSQGSLAAGRSFHYPRIQKILLKSNGSNLSKKKWKGNWFILSTPPPYLLKKSRAWSSWRKRRERNRKKIKRKGEREGDLEGKGERKREKEGERVHSYQFLPGHWQTGTGMDCWEESGLPVISPRKLSTH